MTPNERQGIVRELTRYIEESSAPRVGRRYPGYALIGIVLWCAAVWLAWTVNHRLALSAILGSVAFNLSEWVRDQRLTRRSTWRDYPDYPHDLPPELPPGADS